MNMHMHAFSLFDHISCCWYFFFYQWPKYFQVVLSFHFTCRWLSLSLGKLVKNGKGWMWCRNKIKRKRVSLIYSHAVLLLLLCISLIKELLLRWLCSVVMLDSTSLPTYFWLIVLSLSSSENACRLLAFCLYTVVCEWISWREGFHLFWNHVNVFFFK